MKKEPPLEEYKEKLDSLMIKCSTDGCQDKPIPYNEVIDHRKFCYINKQSCIFGCNNDVFYKGKE